MTTSTAPSTAPLPELTGNPSAAQPHPRRQLVATGFAVAAGAMMIAGSLAFYLARRHASGDHPGLTWLDGHTVPNPQFDYALLTLIASVVTVHWAHWASRRRETGHAWLAIAITLTFGFAFLNMVVFSFNRLELGIGSGEWANLVYATSGLALAVVVLAMFYLGLMALRSLGGSVGRDGSTPLGAAVFFWDFAVVAWTATWYVVFVVK